MIFPRLRFKVKKFVVYKLIAWATIFRQTLSLAVNKEQLGDSLVIEVVVRFS